VSKIKETRDIRFIQIRYTDVPGRFLTKYISRNHGKENDLENLFGRGIGFDGSSVRGFAEINESDLLLIPDRSTFRSAIPLIPATLHDFEVATVIANIYRGFGQGRSNKAPRYVSHCMEEHLKEKDLLCQIGAEVECFIFDDIFFSKDGSIANANNYRRHKPKVVSVEQYGSGKYPIRTKEGYNAPPFQDSLSEFRFEVAEILTRYYDLGVTNLMHEVASNGQIEINFMHDTLTKTADNVQIYKDVVRNVAKGQNKVANFMPKPLFNEDDLSSVSENDNGSGMHTSISLWNGSGSRNIFFDENDDYGELSQTARYFVGGILDHANSLAAFVTPTVNSYYRIIPGFEAPVYIAWARGNRSTVVRIPVDEKNNFKSKRIEFRAPDPSANPYLAFSSIVAAGLDGINRKIDPGNPINENIYKMSDSKRNSLGIKSLPSSLERSLAALKSDSKYLKVCFHTELLEIYLTPKEEEIKQVGKGKSKARQFMFYYDI
jgi:glutamine synthetase